MKKHHDKHVSDLVRWIVVEGMRASDKQRASGLPALVHHKIEKERFRKRYKLDRSLMGLFDQAYWEEINKRAG